MIKQVKGFRRIIQQKQNVLKDVLLQKSPTKDLAGLTLKKALSI